ncbi:MAG: UDP-3-O-acyl-N-acetylglucosamine deacetylase [Rhodospirillales bacterium]|jgi:UDP-3-O-[3-hydroxymyristoyl] N-acetylglucosamine deacetylase|nr:UDP-3-O-acyl-N-acetylglucosamine deacetylase [Rhodospirillales bacterium]
MGLIENQPVKPGDITGDMEHSPLTLDAGMMQNVRKQKTLVRPVNCAGIALHSGATVSITLAPGEKDEGILFRRTDVSRDKCEIRARWDKVVATTMCTTLGNDQGVTIRTVEHLMAALYGCGVDNAVIEVDGPEMPIMDGSAQPFVFLIECAGTVEQDAPLRAIEVLKPVRIKDGGAVAELRPAERPSFTFEIDFDSRAVARQDISVTMINGTFKKEIARARTFGFAEDVEKLRAAGLARGGSLDNAVVVSGDEILNEDGLRYEDEFVRHKVLDAVGDLYLAGAPILGEFQAVCSGHGINNQLVRALFADPDAWRLTLMGEANPEMKAQPPQSVQPAPVIEKGTQGTSTVAAAL